MSTTKLYTEEQVKDIVNRCMTLGFSAEILLPTLTPISLPSDDEIAQEAHVQYPVNLQPNGRTLAGGRYDVDINYSERNTFILSVKWMKDKIQGGNK